MPKKTLPRANGSKKRTVSLPPPFIPPLLPTAPLMTEAAVATATANQIALGTLMICCLTLLAAFSSSMMAGIVSLTNTSSASSAPSVRCSDTDLNSQYPTGRNYFVKGEAKGIWSISGTMQDLTDICKKNSPTYVKTDPASTVLFEYSCWSDGLLHSESYTCPNGCSDGACAGPVSVQRDMPLLMPVQYVLGGSRLNNLITYDFKATSAGFVIDELKFDIGGTAVSHGGMPVVVATLNGVRSNIINSKVIFSGLNLSIPSGYAGQQLRVGVELSCVGVNCPAKSGDSLYLTLSNVQFHDASGAVHSFIPDSMNNVSNPMYIVSSLPQITLNSVSNKLVNGAVKLASVNFSAIGTVVIKEIDFIINQSSSTAVSNFFLKNSQGVTVASGAVMQGGRIVDFVINGGYAVSQTGSQTLNLYGDVSGLSGAIGTSQITVSLSNSASFHWDDYNSSAPGLDGVYLYGYPTNVVSITN